MNVYYPKSLKANLEYRASLLAQMESDPAFAGMVRALCARDIFFWINVMCWTHNPRLDLSFLPFISYPFQDDYVRSLVSAIESGEDLVIEKSRDMGISWLTLYVFQHYWQFGGSGNDFHLGSDKEDLVDRLDDPRALFQKLRFNIDRQPGVLLPLGYSKGKHDHFLRIVNPDTGSAITGESNNPNFSRGGRYRAVMYDEFAFWRHTDQSAWRSGSDTTRCKVAISSANGKNNHFYRLRSGDAGGSKVIRLHWTLHPEKNRRVNPEFIAEIKQKLGVQPRSHDKAIYLLSHSEIAADVANMLDWPTEFECFQTSGWYEYEKSRRSREDLAAEVDIDYAASVANRAAENWRESVHVREYVYNPDLPLELCCDFNIDPMCWNVAQSYKGETFTFRCYTESTTLTQSVIQQVINDFIMHKCKEIHLYGDPAGRARDTRSLKSDWDIIRSELSRAGWRVYYHVSSRYGVRDRVNAVNKRLCDWEHEGRSWEFVTSECVALIDSIEQTELDSTGGIKKNGVEHHFDAWSYRIVEKHPVRKNRAGSVARR